MKKTMSISTLLILLLLFSCSGGNKENNDVFKFGASAKITTLDPATATDTASGLHITNMFEGLIGFDAKGDLVPKLATKWDISDDGLVYTFYLRKGVKFHDNTPFNAEAVKFSLLRQRKGSSYYLFDGAFAHWISGFETMLKDIEVVDDFTVKFIMKQPSGTILSKLAMPFSKIVSPTEMKKTKDNFSRNPIGTGPFKFVSWKPAEHLILEKNENYWNKSRMPKFKTMLIRIIADNSARVLALKKGEIDMMEGVAAQDVEDIENTKGIKAIEKTLLYAQYLFMNNSKPPFNNILVRKAIQHLINRDTIVKGALLGRGVPLNGSIPKGIWGYNEDIKEWYGFDVNKAKALLKEAGYESGLTVDLYYNIENTARKATAEILQSDFKKAGITLNIKSMEWGSFLSTVKNNKYAGLSLSAWVAGYVDPDIYLNYLFTSQAAKIPANNSSFFKNKEFDDLVEKARILSDITERKKLYKQAQQILYDQAPVAPLYSINDIYGAKDNVNEDFEAEPTGMFYYNTLSKK